MPRFKIVTIVRGTNEYVVDAATKEEAEAQFFDRLERDEITTRGEDRDQEFINRIDEINETLYEIPAQSLNDVMREVSEMEPKR